MQRTSLSLNNLIVYTALLLFTLGQLEIFIVLKISNAMHVTLFFLLIIYVISARKLKSKYGYFLIVGLILSILLLFPIGVNIIADLSRFAWFYIMILLPLHALNNRLRYIQIIKPLIIFYLFIGAVIILDSFVYFVTDHTVLFDVELYLTPRFSGCFNDSNFLGLIYGTFFIISLYIKVPYVLVFRLVSFICILLSGSFSVILFVIVAISFTYFLPLQRQWMKAGWCVLITFIAYPLFFLFNYELSVAFKKIVLFFIDLPESIIEIKFRSLTYRLDTVSQAIGLLYEKPFGYGYRSLLTYLPRDTHNSYIGMAFEYGFYTLIVIMLSLAFCATSKVSNSLVWFLCLMGMMLNIHYSPIYMVGIVVAIVFKDQNYQDGILRKIS
jgi:hypothetical protein